MNKPYLSIAFELHTKLPYKINLDIWIKIMKEVKKILNYISNTTTHIFNYPKNIFLHINKRSYNMYLLKKIFKKMRNKLQSLKYFSSLDFRIGINLFTLDYADISPSFFNRNSRYSDYNQAPRNIFNYSQSRKSSYLYKKFLISDTKYNSTSYTKIYNTIYFIMNKFPLYKTKKYLDLNFNTLIQTWIKTFNLQYNKNFNLHKKKKLKIFNKPYQSIALELYTKLPYKLDKNIWIKIIKVKKKKS